MLLAGRKGDVLLIFDGNNGWAVIEVEMGVEGERSGSVTESHR